MSVTVVVGGQYGSEGKGNLVRHLADEYSYHVRVGGPNAGHSIQVDGRTWKMQQVPCGWANPNALLVLGAGAVVSREVLQREIQELQAAGYRVQDRILIDPKATILLKRHHDLEGGVDGALHKQIGSTGEGVGAARLGRLRRDAIEFMLAGWDADLSKFMCDTVYTLNTAHDNGRTILIEGTQGSGLSITHGDWPYVTTSDPNVSGIMADVGLAPGVRPFVVMVVRTFPIRVAGNSGQLEDEITWQQLSSETGFDIEERTTVTKKVRRVGRWNEDRFRHALLLNRPDAICVNFLDYLSPEDAGKTSWGTLSNTSQGFVEYVEELAGVPVWWVGTGGAEWSIVDRRPQQWKQRRKEFNRG